MKVEIEKINETTGEITQQTVEAKPLETTNKPIIEKTFFDKPLEKVSEKVKYDIFTTDDLLKLDELYADVYSKVYDFHSIGLRYFNVFGPKQNANNPYAAVIPIFCKHFIEGTQPTINGDGLTSRDFTFVENAVQANIRALLFVFSVKENSLNLQPSTFNNTLEKHEVFNMACGDQVTLNEMIEMLKVISKKDISAIYGPERKGDVKHSKANILKISNNLDYNPKFRFQKGLEIVFEWYKNRNH